jgi:hypothetical protein
VPLDAAVAPTTVTTASFAGELLTVCNAPDVMMDGLMGSVAVTPVASAVSAVMTNCCRRPVER